MRRRSAAEWVTFAAASAVVLAVVGLLLARIPGEDAPPVPTATVIGRPEARAGRWVVRVEVANRGDATAENVQVVAELVVGGDTAEGEQTVDFLSGGETEQLEFMFDDDPSTGELTVAVASYAVP